MDVLQVPVEQVDKVGDRGLRGLSVPFITGSLMTGPLVSELRIFNKYFIFSTQVFKLQPAGPSSEGSLVRIRGFD